MTTIAKERHPTRWSLVGEGTSAGALKRLLAEDASAPVLRRQLARIAPFLFVELEDEEGPGGLLEEVISAEPALERRTRRLRRAHRRIRGSTQRLLDLLEAREPRDATIQAERRRLARLLEENHHTEARLLQEALYRDTGGEA